MAHAGTIVHAKVGFIVTHSVVYILNGRFRYSFRYITANWILKAGSKAHFQIGGWLTTESEFYKFWHILQLKGSVGKGEKHHLEN